jgi:hypothetical protein
MLLFGLLLLLLKRKLIRVADCTERGAMRVDETEKQRSPLQRGSAIIAFAALPDPHRVPAIAGNLPNGTITSIA